MEDQDRHLLKTGMFSRPDFMHASRLLDVARRNASACLCISYLLVVNWLINYEFISPINSFVRQAFSFCINLLFILAAFQLLKYIRSDRLRMLALAAFMSLLSIYVVVLTFHYLLYGQPIGLASVFAILDSNPQEAREFWSLVFRPDYLIVSLLSAAPALFLAWFGGLLRTPAVSTPVMLVNLTVIALVLLMIFLQKDKHPARNLPIVHGNPMMLSVKLVHQAVTEKKRFADAVARLNSIKQYPVSSLEGGAATHILVIGESTTSRHMSLYGYPRETTPRLDSVRSQLYIAANACSSRTQTIPSLNELLTFATRENQDLLYTAPNLLQVMRSAGFKTYWISNQSSVGEFETWIKVLARTADKQFFLNGQHFSEGASLDEKVLSPLVEVLSERSEKKFIVIHLLGTHVSYSLRYPKNFEYFKSVDDISADLRSKWKVDKSAKLFNQYDNAVRYNDHVLAEILELARHAKRATVTYLSDHGELVGDEGDQFGHFPEYPYRAAWEIPLFFWLSPDVREGLKMREAAFRRNLSRPYQSDALKHTLLDLYQVGISLYQTSGSLLSDAMETKPRRCDEIPAHSVSKFSLAFPG